MSVVQPQRAAGLWIPFALVAASTVIGKDNPTLDVSLQLVTRREVNGLVSGVQEFEKTPSDAEVNPGTEVRLQCQVRNRRGECVWLKNGYAVGKIPDKYDFEREPQDGDCSVLIRKVNLDEDDGSWQCQVTRASLQDAPLNSNVAKLVVREKPHPPRLEEGTQPLTGQFKTKAGDLRRFQCVSRKGNPPASLRWQLDGQDVTTLANQTNQTDVEKRGTWQALSVLDYTFVKEHNGRELRCVAYHGAYEDPSGGPGHRDASVILDVMYPPEIKYEGHPREEVEEGGSLTLNCVADANPPANILWRKSGQSSIYDISHSIHFSSIQRTDSGVYSCSAKNDFGESAEIQVTVNVKYRPKIIQVDPSSPATFNVDDVMTLHCVAEGNPVPKITWLQQNGRDPNVWNIRGRNATLTLANASYSYQGIYRCEASNVVKNQPYRVQSQEVRIDIRGPPQIMAESMKTRPVVVASKEEDVAITVVFCADPKPVETFWGWGSYKLKTGSALGRFVAEPLLSDEELEDCYESRLLIQKVESDDSRKFTLFVDNGKGKASYSVALEVKEPLAMTLVIAIAVGGVVFLIVFLTLFVYLVRSEKMCFRRRHKFSPDGESDVGSTNSQGTPLSKKQPGGGGGHVAIPPDALYTPTSKNNGSSKDATQYENVKNGSQNGRPEPPPRASDGSIVYASLDLPAVATQNGSRPAPERTEYAELQFQANGAQQLSSEHVSL
ncbi:kin of IRRE-like protein 2 isoform X1 [Dermacentor andersoni]|uniref:kin of IRRE-like protein 2 isoform X1 n=1 Tax=Dermacentor andersoni TaxID=34620 RepID=UPI002417B9B8|nr:kin of IRRE-like protein 1 isoform X1 [Dermacentor andersoni]